MRNFFADTNIIIDFLADREPFSTNAAAVFDLAERNEINIFVSSVSYNIVYYVLRRKFGHKNTIGYLGKFSSFTSILDVTGLIIKAAIASDNPDFEDAIQYYTAVSNPNIEAIITRDKLWFGKGVLPVFKPEEIYVLIK